MNCNVKFIFVLSNSKKSTKKPLGGQPKSTERYPLNSYRFQSDYPGKYNTYVRVLKHHFFVVNNNLTLWSCAINDFICVWIVIWIASFHIQTHQILEKYPKLCISAIQHVRVRFCFMNNRPSVDEFHSLLQSLKNLQTYSRPICIAWLEQRISKEIWLNGGYENGPNAKSPTEVS